jgi:hypothetical protein
MKTTFKYDHYYKYEEMENQINYFTDNFKNLFILEVIGKSIQNRNIYACILGDKSKNYLDKPAMYIDANTHAGEVTGSMAALYFMDYYLTNNKEFEQMLKDYTVYVIPRIAVDGAEEYLTTPHTLRSLNQEYKCNHDGLTEKDLDNDGVIRMMKVKDQFGAWVESDNDFDLLLREPDQTEGEFYNLYVEGEIENYSGKNFKIQDLKFGMDFNRNYPFGWFNDARQAGAGDYPLSNTETKSVVDFVINHPNINVVSTNHTCGGVFLAPPGTYCEKDGNKFDMKVYNTIGKMATKETGYPVVNIFDSFITDKSNYSSGAFDDYCYENLGIYAYTIELWDVYNQIKKPIDWKNFKQPDIYDDIKTVSSLVKWVKEVCPEELKPWTKVNHPQLGEVEVGGVNYKFTYQNPPTKMLLKEVENVSKFYLRYLKTLSKIVIKDISLEEISENIYKIDMTIANTGYLPTYLSNAAKKAKVNKPIEVIFDINEKDFISGHKTTEIIELEGFSSIDTGMYSYSRVVTTTKNKQTESLSWIIKAIKGDKILVSVNSQKSGSVNYLLVV